MWLCEIASILRYWVIFFHGQRGSIFNLEKKMFVNVLGKLSFTNFPLPQGGSAVFFMLFVGLFQLRFMRSREQPYWVSEDEAKEIWSEIMFKLPDILPGVPEVASIPSKSGSNLTCLPEANSEYLTLWKWNLHLSYPFLLHFQTGLYLFACSYPVVYKNLCIYPVVYKDLCIFLSGVHTIHPCWKAVFEKSLGLPQSSFPGPCPHLPPALL